MYLFLFLFLTHYMFRAHRTHHQERQLPEVVLTQFVSPDDEHDVLETCSELKIKINTQQTIVRHVGHLPRSKGLSAVSTQNTVKVKCKIRSHQL
jgi:hypothetical protein